MGNSGPSTNTTASSPTLCSLSPFYVSCPVSVSEPPPHKPLTSTLQNICYFSHTTISLSPCLLTGPGPAGVQELIDVDFCVLASWPIYVLAGPAFLSSPSPCLQPRHVPSPQGCPLLHTHILHIFQAGLRLTSSMKPSLICPSAFPAILLLVIIIIMQASR